MRRSGRRSLICNRSMPKRKRRAANWISCAIPSDLATDSLRLTTLRYQAGEAIALEVVDAQNTLTTGAQQLSSDGEARYHVAIANLQTLTGSF